MDEDKVEGLFSLRDLYYLIPKLAGIEEHDLPERDYVRGARDYPYFDIIALTLPQAKKKELWKKFSFVRSRDRKLVKSQGSETNYKMIDLSTDEEIPIQEEFVEMIEEVDGSGKKRRRIPGDPQIKRRLSKLGYI